MPKPKMGDWLGQFIRDHQDAKPSYEEADQAWRAAGGGGPLNKIMFDNGYRTWNFKEDGSIGVGPRSGPVVRQPKP